MRKTRAFWFAASLALVLPAAAAAPDDTLKTAQEALERGDGIAAEVALQQALDQGVPRVDVAAAMGAAELLQGNLDAAAAAFNKALAIDVGSAEMWVDIGRLRYRSAQHHLALEAAENALTLEPENPRANEFRGQLARDAQGLRSALIWFERGLKNNPDDIGLLGEYAATLGELGRAREMLKVTRRMIELGGADEKAFFLQATLAARAGNDKLARNLLWRAGKAYSATAAGMVLGGVLDLRAGNPGLALQSFEKLASLQPDNQRAQVLLARGQYLDGDYRGVIEDFAQAAQRDDAPVYLIALVGRSYEVLGDRNAAAPFLDRATRGAVSTLTPVDAGEEGRLTLFRFANDPLRVDVGIARIRELVSAGNFAGAQAVVNDFKRQYPASIDVDILAGDVALAAGDPARALTNYLKAKQVRCTLSLVERIVAAHRRLGDLVSAEAEARDFLFEHPMDGDAARLVADFALAKREWQRAYLLLVHARALGGGERDAGLLADLSRAALEAGRLAAAQEAAEAAFKVQRTNGAAASALARTLSANGDERAAQVLFAKANKLKASLQPAPQER